MRAVEFPIDDFPNGLEATNLGLPGNAKLDAAEMLLLDARFTAYVEAGGRGDLLEPEPYWNSPRGEAITAAYKQTYKGGRLFELRGQLKLLMANRCPSCGGARPGELDHHLPKAHYRELALLPANLVACCGACNRTKRAAVGAVPEEALLHPYFDRVPKIPFMVATIEVGDRHVRATLTFDEAAEIEDNLLKARMRNHFKEIEVNEQLKSEVDELINEASAGFVTDPPLSPETVKTSLLKSADAKADFFGAGCWQAAVFRAMAESDAYCDGGYLATRRTVLGG
ncbi:hypothetical protein EJ082_08560 [Brevundimonas diminuta]|jgi:hypothetical protein|uniref:HNH endonuclease n=1 Tax=Brevundimonas diminuta TaxID=293 RepID=A0A410NXL0_BREDI|nr:HNH endonuclease [Brevundimonas diminuta]MBD3573014.1 hypothetical protein [Brevundimonas diminuta]QAT14612.1 hypothetical protein EQG53_09715 [Brevundimonas diminuta]QQB88007.1 hypothetical protein I6H83_12715 [Brevundimonas diminuta]GEC00367.1 hypothetical protein BDI01nite_14310 [Brevundimonas diminuta]